MNLKNAKSCRECRAMTSIHGQGVHCGLNFKTHSFREPIFGMDRIKPAEPCFKPLTVQNLIAAQNLRLMR